MVFFVDNNLSVKLARAMGFLSDVQVEHIKDYPDLFPEGTPDEIWLPWVGRSGRILLTRDLNIAKRPGERKAMLDNAIRGFLIGGKNKDRFQIFANVALHWLAMEKIASELEPPFLITAHSPVGQWKDALNPARSLPVSLCPPLKLSH